MSGSEQGARKEGKARKGEDTRELFSDTPLLPRAKAPQYQHSVSSDGGPLILDLKDMTVLMCLPWKLYCLPLVSVRKIEGGGWWTTLSWRRVSPLR